MKLERNTSKDGRGKYALILLRAKNIRNRPEAVRHDPATKCFIIRDDAIDFGEVGSDSEFFVIRLKDKHAYSALSAYAMKAAIDDPEYAKDVWELAERAAKHKMQKRPD